MLRRVADLRSDYLSDNLDFLVDNVRQNIIRLPVIGGGAPSYGAEGKAPEMILRTMISKLQAP
jgi:hypothetical protein